MSTTVRSQSSSSRRHPNPPAVLPSSTDARPEAEVRERSVEVNRDPRRTQRLQADFLAKLSHDLRTPLTNLREFMSILMDGLAGSLTDVQREYLGIALRNADTLTEMIEHLLVLTRIQQGNLRVIGRRVGLADLLGDGDILIGARPKNKTIRLRVEIPDAIPDVYADPDRLLEAVRNLVDNAVKYSGPEVNIKIIAARGTESRVDLLVRDDGRGIAPATLRHLFHRFRRGVKGERRQPGRTGAWAVDRQRNHRASGWVDRRHIQPGRRDRVSIEPASLCAEGNSTRIPQERVEDVR